MGGKSTVAPENELERVESRETHHLRFSHTLLCSQCSDYIHRGLNILHLEILFIRLTDH